jgi:transposase
MANNQRSKVKMQPTQSIADSVATQGARRANEGATEPLEHETSDFRIQYKGMALT